MMRQPFTVAVLLTVAGMLPFLVLGALAVLDPADTPTAVNVLVSYGAVILSFLGAVHWGFALRDTAHPVGGVPLAPAVLGAERQLLTFGVVPALIGFLALLAMIQFSHPAVSLFMLLVGFFITIVVETIGRGRNVVAGNYLAMRWAASIVVLVVLLVVLFALLTGMRTS